MLPVSIGHAVSRPDTEEVLLALECIVTAVGKCFELDGFAVLKYEWPNDTVGLEEIPFRVSSQIGKGDDPGYPLEDVAGGVDHRGIDRFQGDEIHGGRYYADKAVGGEGHRLSLIILERHDARDSRHNGVAKLGHIRHFRQGGFRENHVALRFAFTGDMVVVEERKAVVATGVGLVAGDKELSDEIILMGGSAVGEFGYADADLSGLVIGEFVAVDFKGGLVLEVFQ